MRITSVLDKRLRRSCPQGPPLSLGPQGPAPCRPTPTGGVNRSRKERQSRQRETSALRIGHLGSQHPASPGGAAPVGPTGLTLWVTSAGHTSQTHINNRHWTVVQRPTITRSGYARRCLDGRPLRRLGLGPRPVDKCLVVKFIGVVLARLLSTIIPCSFKVT